MERMEKITFWGIVCVFAVAFVYHIGGNTLDELALIRRAKVATGILEDSWSIEQEVNNGRTMYTGEAGLYVFRLSDGREFKVVDEVGGDGQKIERRWSTCPKIPP